MACGADPVGGLKEFFVDRLMGPVVPAGERPVFRKAHGVAGGRFTVRPDLPEELRVGLLAGGPYTAWVRFSSDCRPRDKDLEETCGVALKLFGVGGGTHDFLLQNHDVFFVDTARDMCEFTEAIFAGRVAEYEQAHPVTARVREDMRKCVPSVLGTPYWGILPHRFGDERYVKYKLEPEGFEADGPPAVERRDYLAEDFARRLRAGPARFRFMVQLRTDPDAMPLDAATVRWDESASPPQHVATLELAQQDVSAEGQAEYGEGLAFTIWRAAREHEPVGSVADARRVAYAAAGDLRRTVTGVPLEEPAEPRPVGT